MPAKRLLDRVGGVVFDRHAQHVGRHRRMLVQVRLEHAHVDDRNSRKQIGPMTQHVVERFAGDGDDDIRSARRVLFVQVSRQRGLVRRLREVGEFEELAQDLDRLARSSAQHAADLVLDLDVGRKQPTVRIEDKHPARFAGVCGRGAEQQGENDKPMTRRHRATHGLEKPIKQELPGEGIAEKPNPLALDVTHVTSIRSRADRL